jgi:formiminoglutamase
VPLNRCGRLTLHAHFDLRSTTGGLTNENPVRALLNDGLPGSHIVQIGMRSFVNSPAALNVVREAGSRYETASEVRKQGKVGIQGRLA